MIRWPWTRTRTEPVRTRRVVNRLHWLHKLEACAGVGAVILVVGLFMGSQFMVNMGLYLAGFGPLFGPLIFFLFYQRWLRKHPQVARRLGDLDQAVRESALDELLRSGNSAIPHLIEVLYMPRGATQKWNGDEARRLAVIGLGKLRAVDAVPQLIEALEDGDTKLRAFTIVALGQIGDAIRSSCTSRRRRADHVANLLVEIERQLIPLLGDSTAVQRMLVVGSIGHAPIGTGFFKYLRGRHVPDTSVPAGAVVSEYVSEALRKLGKGELVEAFRQTLQRDTAALARLRAENRREIVEGLAKALSSQQSSMAANAAWALEELDAVEALPQLRSQARLRASGDLEVRQACEQAIAKLEHLKALPRPASSPAADLDHLPRPAVAMNVDPAVLPRATSE